MKNHNFSFIFIEFSSLFKADCRPLWDSDNITRSSAKLRLLIEVSSKHTGSHVPSNIEWRSLIK